MYRGKPWTMRMFAGFGTPEDTNKRFKFLLDSGQTGLSTAFDMPTLMGYDPDHARSLGEVGREGVSVATLDDMMRLFGDIPLDKVSTSMTINAPAAVLLALYVAVAEKQGVSPDKLRGTLQNDMLKEFIAQKEWISPIRGHMRIIRDMLVWCTRTMPQWNTISISGYHIREAGATGVQELAFTIADGIGYVQLGIDGRPRRRRVRARACRTSGTSTTTSSRRSRSSAPAAACGPRSCASGSARRTRSRGCSARTRRPQACR